MTECWTNISEGREIDAGVKTSVGEILEETLFEMIGSAFLADGATTEDASLLSGLRPIRGALRSSGLSKLEKNVGITELFSSRIIGFGWWAWRCVL